MSARQQFLVDAMVREKRPSSSGLYYQDLGLAIGIIFVTITLQSKNVWLCSGQGRERTRNRDIFDIECTLWWPY